MFYLKCFFYTNHCSLNRRPLKRALLLLQMKIRHLKYFTKIHAFNDLIKKLLNSFSKNDRETDQIYFRFCLLDKIISSRNFFFMYSTCWRPTTMNSLLTRYFIEWRRKLIFKYTRSILLPSLLQELEKICNYYTTKLISYKIVNLWLKSCNLLSRLDRSEFLKIMLVYELRVISYKIKYIVS